MAIGWIIFGIVATLTAVAGVFVYTKKRGTIRASVGRAMKNGRKKLFRKNVTESKRAITARKIRKRKTPRGKRRARRQAQPAGVFVRHVRPPDDPRVPVRVARWTGTKARTAAGTARDRTRTAWANRKAAKAERSGLKVLTAGPKLFPGEGKPVGSLTGTERSAALRSAGLCGAPTQDKGYCQNRKVIGGDRCQVHGGRSAA